MTMLLMMDDAGGFQITSAAERMSAAVRSMKASGKDQLVIPLTTHQQ